MAAKLIRTLQDFCPGRFEVKIGGVGDDDTYFLTVMECTSYTSEGSSEEESWSEIYGGTGLDLAKLEEEALKVIRRLEP